MGCRFRDGWESPEGRVGYNMNLHMVMAEEVVSERIVERVEEDVGAATSWPWLAVVETWKGFLGRE